MLTNMGLRKRRSSTRRTGSISTAGNAGMTAPWNLCVTSPEDLTTIPTSIPRKKSSLFPICADAILTPVLSFSGLNSCSAAILVRFPDSTISSKSRALWPSIRPTPKYVPKPYEAMQRPGQRFQIDVKFVPSACLKNPRVISEKFYQFTAIDEYSRWRFVEAFDEHNSYSAARFVDHLVKAFPYRIECIQTDNGPVFTNRFTTHRDKPTLFQKHLEQHGIAHKLIRPYPPRHNGKVESSHRKDNERFYATHSFYSFEDFAKQLKRYNTREYNHFPMRPLGWKTPSQMLKEFQPDSVTHD